MAINLTVRGAKAQIDGGVWTSPNKALLSTLQTIDLSSGHHPDRSLELAQLAAKFLGGTVQDHRPAPHDTKQIPR